ncbi:MAG: hypothetical protein L3V56_14915, partial [Candidatus Magnetoovum sp. WYHC-5]|nr:hypothetical protein [Candidatus Magnetoovum sp. WYHC-5]
MYTTDDTITAISTPYGQSGIGIVRLSGPLALTIADAIFKPSGTKTLKDLATFKIAYGHIIDKHTERFVDEVIVSVMKAPKSYTCQDVVEINCHSGFFVLKQVLELTIKHGARLAKPGEFTFRAYINGRIDLVQAEAVMDLIRAATEKGYNAAINQLDGNLSNKINALSHSLTMLLAHIEAYIDFPDDETGTFNPEDFKGTIYTIIEDMETLSNSFHYGRLCRDGIGLAICGKPNV